MRPCANEISFGVVDGRAVFLDPTADSYFLLDPAEEMHFLHQFGRIDISADDRVRQAFGAAGQLSIVRARSPEPSASLLDTENSSPRARLLDVLRIALILRRTCSCIANVPVQEILDFDRHSIRCESSPSEIVARSRRFLVARKLVPMRGNCLTDSLAFLRWLGYPPGAMLVFGAKLAPFAAHCWVQIDQLLLNDHLEYVRRFRPLRVVKCTSATC